MTLPANIWLNDITEHFADLRQGNAPIHRPREVIHRLSTGRANKPRTRPYKDLFNKRFYRFNSRVIHRPLTTYPQAG